MVKKKVAGSKGDNKMKDGKVTEPKKSKAEKVANTMLDRVKELAEQAKSEEMYSWLVGLDSQGPTPRNAAYYRLLYLMAKEFGLTTMLDLGTCEGVSAMCMAKGNPKGTVYTLDRQNKVDERCRCDNIQYHTGDALKDGIKGLDEIELIYIDIEHTPEVMEKAFDIWTSGLIKGGIVLLDGVTWVGASEAMPSWWGNFNPEGFTKYYDVDLHSLEDSGTGILIKQ